MTQTDLFGTEQPAPEKITEAVVLDRLRRRYTKDAGNGPRYVFATHVRSEAGFGSSYSVRTADAVAMDLWPSTGNMLHGHEVKISRSDWLHELRQPEKHQAVARYCHRWWLVVPDVAIVKPGELPAGWGLIVAGTTTSRVRTPAPVRHPTPLTYSFTAALLRAATRSTP